MGRGRDFRGGGSGRGRQAHDEDPSFLDPTPAYIPDSLSRRLQPNDGAPIGATVKWFSPEKGFGFVEVAGSGDAFLSLRALQAFGLDTVSPGNKLSVFVGQGEKGRQVTKIAAMDEGGTATASTSAASSASRPKRITADLSEAKEVFGRVKWFSVEKGMGFIEADDGGKDVFVHMSVVKKAQMPSLSEGQRISMQVTETPKGRHAVSIVLAD